MLSDEDLFKQIYIKHRDILIDPEKLSGYLSNFEDEKKDLFDFAKFNDCRILITGISGFVGSHLAEKLVSTESNVEVYGIVRRQAVPLVPNIRDIIDKIHLEEANLIDYSSIETAIEKVNPHYIFHLAAQSFIPTSFVAPHESVQINIGGTVNLLEVLRKKETDLIGMQVACSSEEYGLVYSDEIPIKESNPLRPQSPYGVSKVATELYSLNHWKSYGIPVVITRGFNHTGPRRGLQFVTSVITSQIARAIKTGENTITIGNPKPIRDFTDIRDMIQGYILAILKGAKGGVYNLGHGFGISVENLIKLTAKLYDVEPEIRIDKERFRPSEVNVLICDYTKAKEEFGYKPQYPLTETMKNSVEFYLKNDKYLKATKGY